MARQAGDGEPRRAAKGWRSLLGPYTATAGCDYQAMALGILARCGTTTHPAERDTPARPIAERDPK